MPGTSPGVTNQGARSRAVAKSRSPTATTFAIKMPTSFNLRRDLVNSIAAFRSALVAARLAFAASVIDPSINGNVVTEPVHQFPRRLFHPIARSNGGSGYRSLPPEH